MTSPPTSGLDVSGPLPGQLVFPQSELITAGIAASTKISVGNPVTFNSSGDMILATNSVGTITDGFGVCTIGNDNTSGAARALYAQAAVGNTYIYYTAAAVIHPMKCINLSSITGNGAQETGAITTVGNILAVFGRYFYHQGESNKPTNTASGDVVAIRLGFD